MSVRGRALLYSVDLSYVNVVAFQRLIGCMLLLTIIVAWSSIVAELSRVEVCFSEAQREGKGARLAG